MDQHPKYDVSLKYYTIYMYHNISIQDDPEL